MTNLRAMFMGVMLAVVPVVASGQPASGPDWPQWRGPNRTGVSSEVGLLPEWPISGPPLMWSITTVGTGYGTVAVQDGRIFVQGSDGGQSVVVVVRVADGHTIWSKVIGPSGDNNRGPGPRGTPTVDSDRVYALTENGDLACLRVEDGLSVWQRNILRDFGARNIPWLISESPLIDGNNVIVTPGGRQAGMVALDKMTGRTVWVSQELSDEAGYASPIVATVQGVRTIMTLTGQAGVGVRASDGKLMWRYTAVSNRTANIATPVFADDKVFYTSAYGTGGALLALTSRNGEVDAQEVYFTRDMQNHHGGVILWDGYLYGFHNSILTCLEFATGKVMWRDRSVGKGSLTYADGHLYLFSENNVVGLAEARPSDYLEKGRFEVADQGLPSWAHPVVSGGTLYIRNQDTLAAYDVLAR